MNMAKIFGLLGAAGLTLMGSSALAAESGWYGGISFGLSRASIDTARIGRELTAAGFAVGTVNADESHTGGKLFAGYRLAPGWALEGGYVDLGRFTYVVTTTAPPGILSGKMRRQGANLDLVGLLPISDRLSAIGRVGVVYISVRDNLVGTGGVIVPNPNPGKDDFSVKAGLGIQYDLNKAIGLRGEIERYQIQDSAGNVGNVDLYTAGIMVKF